MLRYYITDSFALGGAAALLRCARHWIERGVEMIQLREKWMAAAEMTRTASELVKISAASGGSTKVLVNGRVDVAIAAGAHGVHLPSHAISPVRIRQFAPPAFVIGVSCHDRIELDRAVREHADFAVLGPVFSPLSKHHTGPVLGLDGFASLARGAGIPVLALGGVTWENEKSCLDAGAAGIAGISLFQRTTATSSSPE